MLRGFVVVVVVLACCFDVCVSGLPRLHVDFSIDNVVGDAEDGVVVHNASLHVVASGGLPDYMLHVDEVPFFLKPCSSSSRVDSCPISWLVSNLTLGHHDVVVSDGSGQSISWRISVELPLQMTVLQTPEGSIVVHVVGQPPGYTKVNSRRIHGGGGGGGNDHNDVEHFEWDDGVITHRCERDDVAIGQRWVQVLDVRRRRLRHNFVCSPQWREGEERPCRQMIECSSKWRHVKTKVEWIHCMVEASENVLNAPSQWSGMDVKERFSNVSACNVLSALSLATELSSMESTFAKDDSKFSPDEGAIYVALLTLEPIDALYRSLLPRVRLLLSLSPIMFQWYEAYERGMVNASRVVQECMYLLLGRIPMKTDVLFFGPHAFNNDLIFAPILAASGGKDRKVISMMPRRYHFLTSLVSMASIPWRLEVHVHLVSRYLRDAMDLFQPNHVVPTDGAGVLSIAHLKGGSHYPPCALSKLCPPTAAEAPCHVVISQDDGIRQVWPDLSNVTSALCGGVGKFYLKREYSESSSGVSFVNLEVPFSLPEALQLLHPRQPGIDMMDTKLPVRLFLQKATWKNRPFQIGARFFAHNGTVVCAHLSRIDQQRVLPPPVSKLQTVSYVTVRNEKVEQSLVRLIAGLNYSGFGAAWWISTKAESEDGTYLIDFNPRMERHTCFAFATDERPDPCIAFWKYSYGENKWDKPTPFFFPADVYYQDPSRLLDFEMDEKVIDIPNALWNYEKRDQLGYETLLKRINDAKNTE